MMDQKFNETLERKHQYVIWSVFGIFLLYSMSNVFMYFDDFGYASLSYGYVEQNVQGQNFTFSQLRHFLWQTYLGWSGRIVFPGLKILLLKNVWIYRIAQSVLVLISFIALYRLSSGKRHSAVVAFFSIFLYGVFSFEMFRTGFYWFSASATYIFPLAFFFAGCLIMRNIENNFKNKLGYIVLGSFLFFMAGISQEQIAFTLMAFITILCISDYIQFKRINSFRFLFFTASILGSVFLLLAPGNFKRFQTHDLKAPISLLRKIILNLNSMSRHYLNFNDNMIFILLFSCFICYIGYILWKAGKMKNILFLTTFPCYLLFIILSILPYNTMLSVPFYIYTLFSIIIISKYLVYIKDRYLTALFFGALFSQITMLFYSPYIVERMEIIFYFALFALFIHTFNDMQTIISKKRLLVLVILPVALMSSINLAYKTHGYLLNKPANIYNDNLLRKASEEIKAGKKYKEIELMSMPNARFASDFPDYMHMWMCEFYDIPNEVEIHWDKKNTSEGESSDNIRYNGFYENEPGGTWISGNASIVLKNNTASRFLLEGYYPENMPDNSITVTINNKESINTRMIPGNPFGVELDFENTLDNITISIKTEKVIIPKNEGWNEDERELGTIILSWSLSD